MAADAAFMDKLTALCKRRGFIFQSSEIYGGIGGFWDYGPLGVELKRNIKDAWWHDMVTNPPDGPDGKEIEMVGLDCSIIMNPKVWQASGHVGSFSDPMVDCRACKARFRADQLRFVELIYPERADGTVPNIMVCGTGSQAEIEEQNKKKIAKIRRAHAADCEMRSVGEYTSLKTEDRLRYECPKCGERGTLTEPREFNLMFETYVGAVQDASSKAYLRPETAQGIFVAYQNVLDTTRVKVPFGIAQIGKAFRNEINPRNYTFRSREFEQMEIEFFCHADEHEKWYRFWRQARNDWYTNLGLKSDKVHLRDHRQDELAHYASACADVEYLFPFSDEPQELEGIAHRGTYDLSKHQEHSGKDLTYFDDEAWERDKEKHPDKQEAKKIKNQPPYRFLPHVIEPSGGVDRATLAFLCEAYTEDEAPDDKGKMQQRVLMKLHPRLAPIKVAVFPLVKKEGMPEIAESIYRACKQQMPAFYDDKGAVGRRYRRQDEVGTPFCVTVDGDTLADGTVTIRDRDTLAQVRVPKEGVVAWLKDKLGA